MQTNFTLAQLADPAIAEAESIVRGCVHCGFCTATCPTFVLLGDELDSPRGRIYMIKETLEQDRPASAELTLHIDRCLSCLSCMTTCPSGVHYMHLVDHARAHIDNTYKRPWADRWLRRVLGLILPYPGRFRLALLGAAAGKPLFQALDWALRAWPGMPRPGPTDAGPWARLRALFALAPSRFKARSALDRPGVIPAEGERRGRVALMTGCAQPVLAPEINEATARLLSRLGFEVVIAKGAGCCGALVHHMGWEQSAHAMAKANVAAWIGECDGDGLDAVIISASGCGTSVKDYGFMLRGDGEWADKARRISSLTRDISEFLAERELPPPVVGQSLKVAYHSACSMQHGQQIREQPKALLRQAGFEVADVPEGHLCCGSAGTYNILQPGIASRLGARKVANIESTAPDVVATGNIGCMTQITCGTELPVVHTVELLDWATGGPKPGALDR